MKLSFPAVVTDEGGWEVLVSDIRVFVPHLPHDEEAEAEQSCAKKVPQSCEERDGYVVGVETKHPDKVHHPVSHHQQQHNLHTQRERQTEL